MVKKVALISIISIIGISIISFISIKTYIYFNERSNKVFNLYQLNEKSNKVLPKMYQQLTKNVYTNKNITINYPQIINYGDNNKQISINKVIKSEALKVLNYYEGSTNDVTLDINYIIKINGGNFFSVQYSGIGYSKSGADPNNLFYTTNLIFDKGNKLRLKDLIKIDENFVKIFKRSTYKSQGTKPDKSLQEAAKVAVQKYTMADLIKIFNNADSLDNIGNKNQSDTFSYLTKDSLGISVSIGHGEYAVFEIKFEDIFDYINAKREVWVTFS